MKRAFLFPGQGAQIVGMGKDIYEKYEIAIVTIDTAASEKTYTAKGGKETKLSKKYKE